MVAQFLKTPTLSPGGASGKESTCQCRRPKRWGFDPWVGKVPWRRTWQLTPEFLPRESEGQRSLAGYSPLGRRVGHDWSDLAHSLPQDRWNIPPTHQPKKWPTPIKTDSLLPGCSPRLLRWPILCGVCFSLNESTSYLSLSHTELFLQWSIKNLKSIKSWSQLKDLVQVPVWVLSGFKSQSLGFRFQSELQFQNVALSFTRTWGH